MGLDFGFKVNDKREGAWIGDPAFANVPESARADWEKDGAAVHLLPYAINGKPTVFEWRALDVYEARHMKRLFADWGPGSMQLLTLECFALGVRFPDVQEDGPAQSGVPLKKMTRDAQGFARLSREFLGQLDQRYPGLIDAYGVLIFNATVPSEQEKKASSPPSTETPSSAADSTGEGTAGPSGATADKAA